MNSLVNPALEVLTCIVRTSLFPFVIRQHLLHFKLAYAIIHEGIGADNDLLRLVKRSLTSLQCFNNAIYIIILFSQVLSLRIDKKPE